MNKNLIGILACLAIYILSYFLWESNEFLSFSLGFVSLLIMVYFGICLKNEKAKNRKNETQKRKEETKIDFDRCLNNVNNFHKGSVLLFTHNISDLGFYQNEKIEIKNDRENYSLILKSDRMKYSFPLENILTANLKRLDNTLNQITIIYKNELDEEKVIKMQDFEKNSIEDSSSVILKEWINNRVFADENGKTRNVVKSIKESEFLVYKNYEYQVIMKEDYMDALSSSNILPEKEREEIIKKYKEFMEGRDDVTSVDFIIEGIKNSSKRFVEEAKQSLYNKFEIDYALYLVKEYLYINNIYDFEKLSIIPVVTGKYLELRKKLWEETNEMDEKIEENLEDLEKFEEYLKENKSYFKMILRLIEKGKLKDISLEEAKKKLGMNEGQTYFSELDNLNDEENNENEENRDVMIDLRDISILIEDLENNIINTSESLNLERYKRYVEISNEFFKITSEYIENENIEIINKDKDFLELVTAYFNYLLQCFHKLEEK